MKEEIKKILPQVTNLYLLASGPLFLFKSLRGLSPIEILSDKYSTEVLMKFYSTNRKNEVIGGMFLCYIILVALTFKQYEEATKPLKSLSKEKYMWVKGLLEMALSSFKSLQVESIILEKKPVIQHKPPRNLIADSTTNINVSFKDKKNEN